MNRDKVFTCARCGEVFKKAWSDEEALESCKEKFGFVPAPDDRVIVCSDCLDQIMQGMFQ